MAFAEIGAFFRKSGRVIAPLSRTHAGEMLDSIAKQLNSPKPDKSALKAAFLALSGMVTKGTKFAVSTHQLLKGVAAVYHDFQPLVAHFHL